MSDIIIVVFTAISAVFCLASALWFSTMRTSGEAIISFGFLILGVGILFFAGVRDVLIFSGVDPELTWYSPRHVAILAWRTSMVVGFGLLYYAFRFGSWRRSR